MLNSCARDLARLGLPLKDPQSAAQVDQFRTGQRERKEERGGAVEGVGVAHAEYGGASRLDLDVTVRALAIAEDRDRIQIRERQRRTAAEARA